MFIHRMILNIFFLLKVISNKILSIMLRFNVFMNLNHRIVFVLVKVIIFLLLVSIHIKIYIKYLKRLHKLNNIKKSLLILKIILHYQ